MAWFTTRFSNASPNNPDFKYFHFDGQTTVLPDYVEMRPENKKRLQKLIKDGRILVGPWFTMPDTTWRVIMKIKSVSFFCVSLLLFSTCTILQADSLKEIATALDIDVAFLVKQEYRKYAYDENGFTVEDDDGNPVIQKISNESYWSVQAKTADSTSPYYGKSCLRSSLGSRTPSAKTDNTCTRLYLSFFGTGTFSFAYKTQTDSDIMNVYVDGVDVFSASGYGLHVCLQKWTVR